MAGGHKRVKNQSNVMFPEEQSIIVLSIAIDSKGKDMDKMMEHLKIYAPYYDCFCHFRRTSEENEV